MQIFGLIAMIIMTAILSLGDFYYYQKELKEISFIDWALYTTNFVSVTLYSIITLGGLLLSM